MAANGEAAERLVAPPCVSALYVHLPFCISRCRYCDFSTWATDPHDPLIQAYAQGVLAQARELAAAGLLEGCETAYLGGGTPSLLGARTLSGLIEGLAACCGTDLTEFSFEANPESATKELLGAAHAAGATRVSMGVQSCCDAELAALGRAHDAARALAALHEARAAGLTVSCDLMCAIPEQSDASWCASLAAVLDAGVSHVSVYPLSIEEGTPLARQLGGTDPSYNDGDVQAHRMEMAQELLFQAGLSRYEVASYARLGFSCAHNLAYWTGRPYLGLGTSAASMLNRAGYLRLKELCPQLPALLRETSRARLVCTSSRQAIAQGVGLAGLSWELEELTCSQALAEDLMLGMRLEQGLGPRLLARARAAFGARLDDTLNHLRASGLVEERPGGRIAVTHMGWLLGNEVFGALWDLHGEESTHLSVVEPAHA